MNHRRAVTLVETAIAVVLLGVAMALVGEWLALSVRGRLSSERRALALFEAGNIGERIMALPAGDIAPTRLDQLRLSPAAEATFGASALSIAVDEPAGTPPVRRVVVEIHDPSPTGDKPLAHLVLWRHMEVAVEEAP